MASCAISVVIPTYNRAHLITDALESVAAQTLAPLEVLVVDDGSTDDTRQTVEAWANAHPQGPVVRYLHQQNKGGNAARNLGIAEAKGDVIAFLDSDDLWDPTKTAQQCEVLAASDVGAVYCGVQEVTIGSDDPPYVADRAYPTGDILPKLLVGDVTAPTSAWMVRASLFRQAGVFDLELKARQDWEMWIRLARHAKIGAVPKALVDLRAHAGPRTASDPMREINAYRHIMSKHAPLRAALPFAQRRAAVAAYHRRVGRVTFHYMGRRFAALGHYGRALIAWPFVPDTYAAILGVFLTQGVRARLHKAWNRVLGKTRFSIKSH